MPHNLKLAGPEGRIWKISPAFRTISPTTPGNELTATPSRYRRIPWRRSSACLLLHYYHAAGQNATTERAFYPGQPRAALINQGLTPQQRGSRWRLRSLKTQRAEYTFTVTRGALGHPDNDHPDKEHRDRSGQVGAGGPRCPAARDGARATPGGKEEGAKE